MYFIAISTQKWGTASLRDAVVVLGLCAKLAKKQHSNMVALGIRLARRDLGVASTSGGAEGSCGGATAGSGGDQGRELAGVAGGGCDEELAGVASNGRE
jgi:hypothetical protein